MKANQITAIGVSIIALGVIIAGGIYVNKEREQKIINTERQKEQETRNIYYTCMLGSDETLYGELYQMQRQNGNFSGARETLESCLKSYGITEPDQYYINQFQF